MAKKTKKSKAAADPHPIEEEEALDLSNTTRDSIRKLLEPFDRAQLIHLLKDAALRNPSLLSKISASINYSSSSNAAADGEEEEDHRKIFVHGLGWDATSETLAFVFCQYGEIEHCNVVVDRQNERSKGYGFVLFRTRSAALNALQNPVKEINGCVASCRLASLRRRPPDASFRTVVVTNVRQRSSPERLRAFFEAFGEVEEGPLGLDPATGQFCGPVRLVFKTAEGCRKALEEPSMVFEGYELCCQRETEGSKLTADVPIVLDSSDPMAGNVLPSSNGNDGAAPLNGDQFVIRHHMTGNYVSDSALLDMGASRPSW